MAAKEEMENELMDISYILSHCKCHQPVQIIVNCIDRMRNKVNNVSRSRAMCGKKIDRLKIDMGKLCEDERWCDCITSHGIEEILRLRIPGGGGTRIWFLFS